MGDSLGACGLRQRKQFCKLNLFSLKLAGKYMAGALIHQEVTVKELILFHLTGRAIPEPAFWLPKSDMVLLHDSYFLLYCIRLPIHVIASWDLQPQIHAIGGSFQILNAALTVVYELHNVSCS